MIEIRYCCNEIYRMSVVAHYIFVVYILSKFFLCLILVQTKVCML